MLYKAAKSVIKFFDDYSWMVFEEKLMATKERGLKILNKCFKDYQPLLQK